MARPLSAALALVCLACAGEPARASREEARAGTTGAERPRPAQRDQGSGSGASGSEPAPPPPTQPPPTPRVIFEVPGIGAVPVRVEIARTPAQRARGLMYRRTLEPDAGMLFVYPYPRLRTFWMRNTYVSLDMIFVGRDRRVVGVVERAVPLDEAPCEIDAPAQYIVEVNAGFAREHGIFAGVPVTFEDVPDVLPGADPVEDDPDDEEEEWTD